MKVTGVAENPPSNSHLRFDLLALFQALDEPRGMEHQGFAYYLLSPFDHMRVCCGADRVSNLVISCRSCNKIKGNRPAEKFLAGKPGRLTQVQRRRKNRTVQNQTLQRNFCSSNE